MVYAAAILVTVIPINVFKFKSSRFQMFVNEGRHGRPHTTRAFTTAIRKTESKLVPFPKVK